MLINATPATVKYSNFGFAQYVQIPVDSNIYKQIFPPQATVKVLAGLELGLLYFLHCLSVLSSRERTASISTMLSFFRATSYLPEMTSQRSWIRLSNSP